MEINYIREFVMLAEVGNYLETADKLFIAQSSLSRHIKALEEELGAPLFDRTTRKVTLNHFGKLFLPYAKEISRIQYEYTTAFYNETKSVRGEVTVGSIPSMAQYHITDVLVRFQKENRSFVLNMIEGDSLQLIDLLRKEECDFAFLRETDDTTNEFNKLPFTTDHLAAICPVGHPLAGLPAVSFAQLKSVPLLVIGKDTFMYSLCVSECHKAGFEPEIVFTGKRADNIIDLVAKGMGIALLMRKPAQYMVNDQIAIVDILPKVTTTISLAFGRSQQMSTAATHFYNSVKVYLGTVQ